MIQFSLKAQTGGIKCNAWCRSVKTGELPNQEIKFKKKKTVLRPSVKKISFEKFHTRTRGNVQVVVFFNYVTRIGQTWSEEMCHLSPWVISPALPRKNNSTAELEKHQDGKKHEILNNANA